MRGTTLSSSLNKFEKNKIVNNILLEQKGILDMGNPRILKIKFVGKYIK